VRIGLPRFIKLDASSHWKIISENCDVDRAGDRNLDPSGRRVQRLGQVRVTRNFWTGSTTLKRDGIAVSRDGTILGGHHRWDELLTRINDGRIDPETPIRIDVYGGE
jgi:hypothetical protein